MGGRSGVRDEAATVRDCTNVSCQPEADMTCADAAPEAFRSVGRELDIRCAEYRGRNLRKADFAKLPPPSILPAVHRGTRRGTFASTSKNALVDPNDIYALESIALLERLAFLKKAYDGHQHPAAAQRRIRRLAKLCISD